MSVLVTMHSHTELSLLFSGLIGGHTLEARRVWHLSTRDDQPPATVGNPHSVPLPQRLAILQPTSDGERNRRARERERIEGVLKRDSGREAVKKQNHD